MINLQGITNVWRNTGVGLQILVTLVNRNISWFLYYGEDDTSFKAGNTYIYANKISSCFWIDVIVDLLTGAVFFWASIIMLNNLA